MDIYQIESIDPWDCDCIRCQEGTHIALGNPKISQVLRAIIDNHIHPQANMGEPAGLIVYEHENGSYQYHIAYSMTAFSEYDIVSPYTDFSEFSQRKNIVRFSEMKKEMPDAALAELGLSPRSEFVNDTSETVILFGSPLDGYGVFATSMKHLRFEIIL